MRRKDYTAFLFLLAIVFGQERVFAQDATDSAAERSAAIEQRLPQTTGRERFELLVELVDVYRLQRLDKLQAIGGPATEALEMLPDYPDPGREFTLKLALLHYHAYRRELERALHFGLRAKALARQVGSLADRAFLARRLGDVYRYSASLPVALEEYGEAKTLFEQLGDDLSLGNVLNNMGLIYGTRAEYSAELDSYLLARAVFLRAGELGNAAMVTSNLGSCYRRLGRIEEARAHLEKSVTEATAIGDELVLADSLVNLGDYWLSHEKDPRQALARFQQALELYQKQERMGRIIEAGIHLGKAYLALGDHNAGKASIESALELANQLELPLQQGQVNAQLAEVYQRRGQTHLAVVQLEKAVAIFRQHDLQEFLMPTLKDLATAYVAVGLPEEAYSTLKEYLALRESTWSQEVQERLAEVQVRFEAQEKEKEIVLLKRDQELKKAELARQEQFRLGLLALLAASLVILALLFRQYRLSLRAARMGESLALERERNEELEKIDRIKDHFLANTSHELRTPLYGILGLAEVLRSDETANLSEPAREKLDWILGSAQRLDRLVGELLDFSKLRAGEIELQPQAVDLATLMSTTAELLKPQLVGKKLELLVDVAPSLPAVEADPRRIGQVCFHLLDNAIKFTSVGTVQISARREGERILVTVQDSGPGLAAADQQRIFRAFEQADGSAERSHGGTGLGLALCRELIRLHGSELELESELGVGSSFSFSLPVVNGAQPPSAFPSPPEVLAEV